MDLRTRLDQFLQEMVNRGAIKEGADLRKVGTLQRAFQLTQNNLGLLMRFEGEIDLEKLKIYRSTVIALQTRDLVDHGRFKTSDDLETIGRTYEEEHEIFERFFPKAEFPSLYETKQ